MANIKWIKKSTGCNFGTKLMYYHMCSIILIIMTEGRCEQKWFYSVQVQQNHYYLKCLTNIKIILVLPNETYAQNLSDFLHFL